MVADITQRSNFGCWNHKIKSKIIYFMHQRYFRLLNPVFNVFIYKYNGSSPFRLCTVRQLLLLGMRTASSSFFKPKYTYVRVYFGLRWPEKYYLLLLGTLKCEKYETSLYFYFVVYTLFLPFSGLWLHNEKCILRALSLSKI